MTDDDPHYHGHRQRLRERFLKSGLAGFADYEVVELLLTLAIPRSDVKQPAKALIARFSNLRGILDAPIEELRTVSGIGNVTPVALQIIKAAATRKLPLVSDPHTYEEPGKYRILIKVIDIFGNDTSQAFDVEVK